MFATGRCSCGLVHYEMQREPMIVHCCHCRQCQRETGASFALNAMVELDSLHVSGPVRAQDRPTGSGKGVRAMGCERCGATLWVVYATTGAAFAWVRVGTLDAPDLCPPSVHVFTASKQPWVALEDGAPVFEGFYPPGSVWTAEARARRQAASN